MSITIVSPRCPRCGYDLRGELARWERSCPIEGLCNECGLTVRWGEVLQPHRHRPLWCVEYRPGPLQVPSGAVVTLFRSLRPRRFWSQLRMTQPLRPMRLAIYVVLLTMLPVLCYTVEQSVVALRVRSLAITSPAAITVIRPPRRLRSFRARGRRRIVQPPGGPIVVRPPLGPVLAEAIATPTARTSRVQAVGMPLGMYPPPNSLHRLLEGRRRGTRSFTRLADRSLVGFLYGLGIFALLPLCFVLLPVSRRRARVRWAHIARITAYGWVIPTLVATLFFALVIWAYLYTPIQSAAFDLALGIACWTMVPALIVWWAAAIGRYLHMPNAWPVAIVLALVAFLLLLVLLYYVFRSDAAWRVIVPFVPAP